MHIAFLIRALTIGGAQRQMVTLANGLAKRGHTVAIVVYYPGGEFTQQLDASVVLYSLGKRKRWDILGLPHLYNWIRDRKPDVLYSFLASANLISVTLKPFFPGLKVVWGKRSAFRDLAGLDHFERRVLWMERNLARFADLVIYNSKDNRKVSVELGFPPTKACVIPNGFDTAFFRPDQEARLRVRAEWRIRPQESLVGLVGRLDPIKDHPTFLEAASLLQQSGANVRFACVGDGESNYKCELSSMSEELGLGDRIIWSGFRNDMPAVYNALDMLVSSSTGESFPNTIGEAMACGVPCVFTDVGDSAWIVGNTGRVIPRRDPLALANALEDFLDKPVNIDRQRIRNRIIEHFSVDRMLVDTENALKDLPRL